MVITLLKQDYNTGNFSYPPGANWSSINDSEGNPTRRWGFRNYEKEVDGSYTSREIYPRQEVTIDGASSFFEYELGDKMTVRELN